MATPSVFVGRMIETNGEASIQERTWLGHDQVLFQEWLLDAQIWKRHRHTGHRIDYAVNGGALPALSDQV